jgi:hypothetical protein
MMADNPNELLRQYVGDMLATDKHIHEAVRRQRDDENIQQFVEAHQLVSRLEATLDRLISDLENELERLGGSATSPVKDVVSSALGAMAGMYDKVRSEKVSKMLRDDYTALSLAAISYVMLHTTGRALQDRSVAELAIRHVRELAPMLSGIRRAIPVVVTSELAEDGLPIAVGVAPEAIRETQQAWAMEQVGQSF